MSTRRRGSARAAARQTVNNELAALRRGFKLAIEKRLLSVMPIIKLPKVQNARSGFFEDGDLGRSSWSSLRTRDATG